MRPSTAPSALAQPDAAERAATLIGKGCELGAPDACLARGAMEEDPSQSAEWMGRACTLGLAAGFDKNGVAADAMLRLGFGFVEIGTVTPLPQAGNPRPRLFRLPADGALVNRLGFNNEGHEAVAENFDRRAGKTGIVGVNIGANRDSDDRIYDYVAGVRLFAPIASYLAINVSSPNTPGLRDLQGEAFLDDLLARCIETRDAADRRNARRTAIVLKIAPDI